MGKINQRGTGCIMRIALITFNYAPEIAGGVGNVANGILRSLKNLGYPDTEVITISLSRKDPNSRAFTSPKSWRNALYKIEVINNVVIHRVGTNGSEFEILRYKQKKILASILQNFDLVLIVTGSLQFCNVLPQVPIPVFVQCATRLVWERKSQYKSMSYGKKLMLRLQLPFLSILERNVVKRDFTFIPENQAMLAWLLRQKVESVEKWFPPILEAKYETPIKRNNINRFISVGRLNESRKGWGRLFSAYELAFIKDTSIPGLDVVGLGSLSKTDEAILNGLKCKDSVKVHSNISNSERDKLLQNSSYFLQTSYEEGLGLAALEALQQGLPLICSRTDGSAEYVDDYKNGFLVDQDGDFVTNFSNLILKSSSWNYSEMSKWSIKIFEEKFSTRVSEEKLLRILTKGMGASH